MKTEISPTIDFWISVIFACLAALSTGTVPMPDVVPAAIQHDIKQWAVFLVGYYTIVAPLFPGLSSPKIGPLVRPPSPPPNLVIFLVAGLFLLAPGVAHAKPTKPMPIPPQHSKTSIINLAPDVLNSVLLDLTAAVALAKAQKDDIAAACYGEIQTELTAIQQSQSGSSTLPALHLFYTFQTARGFANAALPNSSLNNACAPLAQQVKLTMQDFIGGLVTGGLAIGPLFGLP